jgi:hypothetical protein
MLALFSYPPPARTVLHGVHVAYTNTNSVGLYDHLLILLYIYIHMHVHHNLFGRHLVGRRSNLQRVLYRLPL